MIEVFGITKAELDRMVEGDQAPKPRPMSREDIANVEPIDFTTMTPEEAAQLRRLLGGVMAVLDAKARGWYEEREAKE